MTQNFKDKLVIDYLHGRPTDTKRYRYCLNQLRTCSFGTKKED